jgi:hypothetical protein
MFLTETIAGSLEIHGIILHPITIGFIVVIIVV